MSIQILRVQRTDDPSSILVRSEDSGKGTLDIKLVATEGLAPYTTQVGAKKTSSLRSKNAPCTQEEFDIVLSTILRGRPTTGIEALKDVEIVAAVDEEKSVTLTIRKRTEGITQRFGTIILAHNEDEEIGLFDWCTLAVQSKTELDDQLSTLNSKFEDQQETVTKLTKQLEDLLQAKKQHEDSLLEKVSLLLNEKKLKIRDQQRLLSAATIDKEKLAQVKATRGSKSKATVTSSKRKRNEPTPAEDSESDDAFEKMDVDEEESPQAVRSEEDERVTPEGTETEDETEDDEPVAPPSRIKSRIGGKGKGKARDKVSPPVTRSTAASSNTILDDDDDDIVLPPRRELAFQGAKKTAPPPVKLPQMGGDDDDTEDDEL